MTNLAVIPPVVQTFYDRTLLKRATPNLVHDQFGQKRPIKKNSGNQIIFRRYESLAANITALTEGTPPTGKDMSKTDVTYTLAQYGDFTKFTDMVSMTNQDPIITEATELLGEQMGNSLDQVYRNVLVAGTSVRYGSGVAGRINVITKLLQADLDKAIRTLRSNNASFINDAIKASTSIGTVGIRKTYWAIVHTDTEQDLEAITGYRSITEYAAQTNIKEGEIGSYKYIRFVSTTNARIFPDTGGTAVTNGLKYTTASTSCDIYATLIFGKDAYGICPLDGGTSKVIVKNLGDAGAADPLNQYGTVGWKATTVCGILNNAFMIRIEHGVTA
jgi:N4-gp56 family major capsid protein